MVLPGLVMLLAACATPAAPGDAPALEGTRWAVTALHRSPTLETHRPTMDFVEGRVGGTTGCNSYGAGFTQSGSRLTLGSDVAVSAMACTDPDVMEQEAEVVAALPAVASLRASANGLELLDAAQQPVFTLTAAVDKPLEGTTWTLSGIVTREAGVSSPVAGSNVTMTVTAGTLSGKACNTFRGPVTTADGNFRAGPLMSTKLACLSDELTRQETDVLAGLEAARRHRIERDTLTLTAADGTGLVFTAA